jgi:outer membrane lipopolysaccharide assembly protein LptE/RlpB
MQCRRLLQALVLAVPVLAAGCGYALAGRGSFLPAYIRTVAIPPVENRTAFVRWEQVLTERIQREFIDRGKYVVVSEPAGAEAVLRAEILSISLEAAGLNNQQLQSRTRVTLVMKVSFEDLKAGEVLWSNDALTFRDEYDFSVQAVEGAAFLDQQRSSAERMAADAARSVVTAIMEAF